MFPLLETLGNLLVWSEKNLAQHLDQPHTHQVFSIRFSVCRMPSIMIGWCIGCAGCVGGSGGWVLVDRTFWHAILRWPFSVSMDLGRCLRTRLDMRPGQVVKNPVSMALHQVFMTVLKQAW